jgi:choline-sulfatase
MPSRANFITGRYTHDTGNWDNSMPYSGAECQSFGHRLAEQGHQFTTIGKLHYRYLDDDNGMPDSRLAMNHERCRRSGRLLAQHALEHPAE